MPAALRDAIREDREDEPAGERRAARRPSDRSQPYASPPASTYEPSTKTFQAATGPAAANSGQSGRPKSQPWNTVTPSATGWNEYGSVQGVAASARRWPTSHSW